MADIRTTQLRQGLFDPAPGAEIVAPGETFSFEAPADGDSLPRSRHL